MQLGILKKEGKKIGTYQPEGRYSVPLYSRISILSWSHQKLDVSIHSPLEATYSVNFENLEFPFIVVHMGAFTYEQHNITILE